MSLVLNALPSPQAQVESLQRELHQKTSRIRELEEELSKEKTRNYAIEISAANLRTILHPLYNAIGGILGHIDAMDITTDGRNPSANRGQDKVWESWKQKLGGLKAKAIDILLLHGPMTSGQLRIQLACATRTCTNVVGGLKSAGLIVKVDGKISLKELSK